MSLSLQSDPNILPWKMVRYNGNKILMKSDDYVIETKDDDATILTFKLVCTYLIVFELKTVCIYIHQNRSQFFPLESGSFFNAPFRAHSAEVVPTCGRLYKSYKILSQKSTI